MMKLNKIGIFDPAAIIETYPWCNRLTLAQMEQAADPVILSCMSFRHEETGIAFISCRVLDVDLPIFNEESIRENIDIVKRTSPDTTPLMAGACISAYYIQQIIQKGLTDSTTLEIASCIDSCMRACLQANRGYVIELTIHPDGRIRVDGISLRNTPTGRA
jgi:hypothetical protein